MSFDASLEWNHLLYPNSGYVGKKLGKNIACTCMEYIFWGEIPSNDIPEVIL